MTFSGLYAGIAVAAAATPVVGARPCGDQPEGSDPTAPDLAKAGLLFKAATSPDKVGAAFNVSFLARRDSLGQGIARYCGVSQPQKPVTVSGSACAEAAVVVMPSGRLQYREGKEPGTFCLEATSEATWGSSVLARIAIPPDNDNEAYCGVITHGATYRGPDSSKSPEILSLRVWASWAPSELAQVKQSALAAVADLEARYVQDWFYGAWAAAVRADPKVDGTKLAKALDVLKASALKDIKDGTNAFAEIGALSKDAKPDREVLYQAVRNAYDQIARNLPKADPETLCTYSSTFATTTPDGLFPPAVFRPELKIADSDGPTAVRAVGVAYQPAAAPALPWPVFEGTIPGTRLGITRVIEAQSGGGRHVDLNSTLVAGDHLLIFGHDLARDQTVAGVTTKGDSLNFVKGDVIEAHASDVGVAVASLLRAVTFATGMAVAADARSGSSPQCSLCDELKKFFDDTPESALPPLQSQWTAPFTSTVIGPGPLEASRPYTVLVCRKVDTCDTTTASVAIVASYDFVTEDAHRFISTVTELGGNWFWKRPIGGWTTEPVVGTSDPSLLCVGSGHNKWIDHMTLSQLLVAYPYHTSHADWAQGIAFGLGPSLIEGGHTAVFRQWNFRALWEPWFARGVTVSAGMSARLLSPPRDVPEGALLVGSMEMAPSFSQDETWGWLFSAGIGIDLSILGDAWDQAGKALGSSN